MRAVELTIHHLMYNGFSARHQGNPCAGMIYTAFQERATRISHGNVGKIAAAQGDENLGRICRRIAGDEARHETFYTRIVGQMIERDPEAAAAYQVVPLSYDEFPELGYAALLEAARAFTDGGELAQAEAMLKKLLKDAPAGSEWAKAAAERAKKK